jgi:hypothetical protein
MFVARRSEGSFYFDPPTPGIAPRLSETALATINNGAMILSALRSFIRHR